MVRLNISTSDCFSPRYLLWSIGMIEDSKITDFKEITSENPMKQIWKLLRFFLDESSVSEMIRRIHGIEKGEHDQNVKKQARQIGYCIRQAEEYFHASSQVGLPTRPLLLYYGASSLSWALILLRKGGDYSFDKLRKDHKHKHHGLDVTGKIRSEDSLETFLNSLRCKCHTKDGIPRGTFPLFYEVLVPHVYHIESTSSSLNSGVYFSYTTIQDCTDKPILNSLVSRDINTLELVRSLPDTFSDLSELDIRPNLCKGSVTSDTDIYLEDEKVKIMGVNYYFFIDQVTPDQKGKLHRLIELTKSRNPDIEVQDNSGSYVYMKLSKGPLPPGTEEVDPGRCPDIVDDLSGRKFYILDPETYLPEPATHFILLYCLGMLSRYYPDKWMEAIDRDVQITEFTDSLLNVIYRKFPNLILDQMRRVKHYVHI